MVAVAVCMKNIQTTQREPNPDVNSYNPDVDPSENGETTRDGDSTTNIEGGQDRDVIPVPPDATPSAPVEEPPGTDGPPVGDVDDSPKRIA
jgi:hypothetical protein